jgi:hydroxyacylglutathione hydrolase
MIFERFEDEGLSHYSYAVGCPGAGKIAIVDPKRDIDTYLEFAEANNVEIAYVLETHIHADYASGAPELIQRTGAELWISVYDDGEIFDSVVPHKELQDGDVITIGGVKLQAMHTPGHTPEHMSYLVFDTNRSEEIPMLMMTGDFLFVGSLGRPDLLGEDAKRQLANQLFESVQKLSQLPDSLEIHPAHGAGSMCGAGMSGRAMSTLGFERIANPYLDSVLTQELFVEKILGNSPPFPEYYKRMKQLNSDGATAFDTLPGLSPLDVESFNSILTSENAVVVDIRDQLSFGGGHIPGAYGIGCGKSLSTWTSWVLPYDRPILLVADDESEIEPSVRSLIRVGLDDVRGYLKGGIRAWREVGHSMVSTPQLSPETLHQQLQHGEVKHLIDVRSDAEWEEGHIEGALHLMGGTLEQNLDQLPGKDDSIVIVCGSGYRSTVAASVLQRHGYTNLINATGGMTAWYATQLPTVSESPQTVA